MNEQIQRGYEPMSASDFAAYGVQQIAYVKPVEVEGKPGFAVHAADGTPLTMLPDRDVAFAVVRQNDLEPVSTH